MNLLISLLIPIAYLGILIGSMATFSHLYRQRQITSKLRLAPYFGAHTTRNIYLSLLHMQEDPNTKVPDSVLRAALLSRAIEDIERIMEIRLRKGPAAQLLQRGVVGDEIFQRLTRAEQEMEFELKDVCAEANGLAPGWGNHIYQSANEMVQNRLLREKIEKTKSTLEADKLAWEAQRERSRRELEGEATTTRSTTTTVTNASTAGQVQPAASASRSEQVGKTGSSDEDGVIVEPPAAEATASATSNPLPGGGKNKKKKGKK
jgi:translocation protein SEC66